jgi:type IV pilus assembly protein PilM
MTKQIVCFDIGSDTLKMALFGAEGDALQLEDFAVVNLGVPPDTPVDERNSTIAQTIRYTLDERKLRPKAVHLSLSGQSVFVRFVKLPAVDESKIAQIVRYEAQQQVPFPIEEVEWDHQIIGDVSGEEIDIVLVAIKTEVVSGLVEAIRKRHIEVETVDVSALALYNAMIYNEGPFEASTALIDLGARTTNLIIAEGINLWSRSIPIGGENFTQAIAKELEISNNEAAKLKRLVTVAEEGPPAGTDDNVRRASEAATKVLNRLLAEIRRSVGYYRTQSQGTAVQRILLSGGGSFVKKMGDFLAQKLRVEAATLSPLAKVSVAPSVNAEALKAQGALLGDVVGLGLRAAGRGIMKTNLLPKAIVYQRELSKKKVFIIGAAACLIASMVLLGLDAQNGARDAKRELDDISTRYTTEKTIADNITGFESKLDGIKRQYTEVDKLNAARLYWVDFIETIKNVKPQYAWFTRITVGGPQGAADAYASQAAAMRRTSRGPGSDITMPPDYARGQSRVTSPGVSRSQPTSSKTTVELEGYLKITKRTTNPERDLADQVEDLRRTLEEKNKFLSNVSTVQQDLIAGTERAKERLARFVFQAELNVPIEF